jgi:hypothetical protein
MLTKSQHEPRELDIRKRGAVGNKVSIRPTLHHTIIPPLTESVAISKPGLHSITLKQSSTEPPPCNTHCPPTNPLATPLSHYRRPPIYLG